MSASSFFTEIFTSQKEESAVNFPTGSGEDEPRDDCFQRRTDKLQRNSQCALNFSPAAFKMQI